MNRDLFLFKTGVKVRTFEIDSQGIVHNLIYFKYFEIGRMEYRRNLGYTVMRDGTFNDGMKVVVVHNSIDYKSFGFLDDDLDVYTRISWIKNSSFCFEQFIENPKTGDLICEGRGILVNINPSTNLPEKLEDKFLAEIKNFERKLEVLR